MFDSFQDFKNEGGLYYIISSFNQNNSLSIFNDRNESNTNLIISSFDDSIYQAFYIFKYIDNSYFILNIYSMKFIGVKNINDGSNIIQNYALPLDNYKWNIIKIAENKNEYYIRLNGTEKYIDFNNNNVVINRQNIFSNSQRFIFKECLYNIPKSQLWKKKKKKIYRNFVPNQYYIIRSAENDNNVFNLDLQTNNITLKNFNGNKEQIFFIIKYENNYFMLPFNNFKQVIGKEIGIGFPGGYLKKNNKLLKLNINQSLTDISGIPLYNIYDNSGLYLEKSKNNNFLEFNYYSNYITQKFYFSLINLNIFKKFIRNNLLIDFLSDLFLDGIKNILYENIKSFSLDKNEKFPINIDFKNIKTLEKIKINIEWLNKFNTNNIISIEFNDNISELDLNLLKDFKNLNELHLPLSINKIKGLYNKNIPNLIKLECDPKLLIYFENISLKLYIIHKELKEISIKTNFNPFNTIYVESLFLCENLIKIEKRIFEHSNFNTIVCNFEQVKFLGKNCVSNICIIDKKITKNYKKN